MESPSRELLVSFRTITDLGFGDVVDEGVITLKFAGDKPLTSEDIILIGRHLNRYSKLGWRNTVDKIVNKQTGEELYCCEQ
jgi:hypothetical protein